jgi:predicted 3-demethylubiquinone-9 3-methyltransferase (glyoxalase superfamily)
MNKVTPFLTFDGQAEEAAQFYVSLLPDSRIDRITRSPMDTSGGPAGSALIVEFTLGGSPFVALNTPGFKFTEAVSFMIACKDQEENDRVWEAFISNGGSPLACGWLKDRWGVHWQVTPVRLLELIKDPDPERGRRAMSAMMSMIKIDIAALDRAADGAGG